MKLTISSRVEALSDKLFEMKNEVTEIEFLRGVGQLEGIKIHDFPILKTVIIGEGVTKIPAFFLSESKIEKVVLPDTIEEIKESAFEDCLFLEDIKLPPSVKKVGKRAFRKCSTVNFILPPGLTHIGEKAFSGCTFDEELRLPETLVEIGRKAFYNTRKLKKIYLPKSVEVIGGNFFNKKTTRLFLDEENPYFTLEEGKLYTKDKSVLILVAQEKTTYSAVTSFILDENTKEIREGAFDGCNFHNIYLNSNIKVIPKEAFRDAIFTEIFLPEGLERIEELAFYKAKGKSLVLPNNIKKIEKKVFVYARIEELILSDEIVEIEGNAFLRFSTTINAFPKKLKRIGRYAFSDNQYLKGAILPEGLEVLEGGCFSDCYLLEEVRLPNTLKEIGFGCFDGCENLSEISLPEGLEKIGEDAFVRTSIKEISLPKGIKELGIGAFNGIPKVEFYDDVRRKEEDTASFWRESFFSESDHSETEIILKSAKTDEIIYRFIYVPIKEEIQGISTNLSSKLFGEDNSFDFETYDSLFGKMQDIRKMVKVAFYRLKYPYGLTEENKIRYKAYLCSLKGSRNLTFLTLDAYEKQGMEGLLPYFQYDMFSSETLELFFKRVAKERGEKEIIEILNWKRENLGFEEI